MPTPLTTDQLVAQSKAMLAQTAAEGTKAFAGSSYDTVKPTTPVVTPSSLKQNNPIQPYTSPTETPIPDLSHFAPAPQVTAPNPADTASTLGATEIRYKNMIDELMGVNTALEGKSAYTAQQNEALGVNAASDAITGLNSQLTGLINESKAIPLAIQQNAQQGGANVTKGGLAPIQTAQLRNNAIQSLAVSSQIDAMNGQLSNAIKKVDRAVALKYGDLEARSAILTKNLEILSKDPSLTLEQQDRVAKKLDAQKKYDAQLEAQKKNETDTHDARLKALSNNTGNPKLTQQVVEVLQHAQTPEEVAALVNYYGLSSVSKADQLDQTYKQAQIDKMNYDNAHPNRQTQLVTLANGHQALIDTNTGATIKDYGAVAADGGSGGDGTDSPITTSAKDWLAQFNSGLMTIEDIYTKIGSSKESLPLRNEVARLVGLQGGKRIFGADDASVQAINSQIKNINDLLDGDVGSIVGFVQGGLGIWPDALNVYKQDALAIARNLVANQTLQALADAKSKGITFGALSERELSTVADAASRVAAKIKKDKDGNIIGFSGSQGTFIDDLKTIKTNLEKSIANKTQSLLKPEDHATIDAAFSSFNAANFY